MAGDREAIAEKVLNPARRRRCIEYVMKKLDVSERARRRIVVCHEKQVWAVRDCDTKGGKPTCATAGSLMGFCSGN